jgi:hypothetical protein
MGMYAPHGRARSATRISAPGAGIEPAGACFRGRCSVPAATPPGVGLLLMDTPFSLEVRGEGVEPSPAESKAAGLPLADPRSDLVQAEGEGVEPSRLALGRFQDGCHRRLARPSTCSCGGRNRTCTLHLNRVTPYLLDHTAVIRHRTSRTSIATFILARLPFPPRGRPFGVAPEGLEPSHRFPDTKSFRVFVCSCRRVRLPEHPAGLEPAHPAWQAGRLPLHHGYLEALPSCQRADSGTRGARTLTTRVRAGDAAANTLIPFGRDAVRCRVGPEGVEPSSLPFKRRKLCRLSYDPTGESCPMFMELKDHDRPPRVQ